MKICAGIVLFQPDLDKLIANINSIAPQIGHIFIVDNASMNISEIIPKFSGNKYVVIQNGENLGIAKALNQLIACARKNEYQWILTLDQDSISDDFLVKKLCSGVKEYPHAGMVTPYIIDLNLTSLEEYKSLCLPESEIVQTCQTSGTLTNVDAVIGVGGFEEKLFIDHVDHEMCLRLRKHDYSIIKINSAYLLHEVGKGKRKKFLGRKIIYHYYNPKRVYYQTRNLLYMLRKYKKEFKKSPVLCFICYCAAFGVKLILEPQRFGRFYAFFKGFFAGLIISVE
jgi:rhamnosyltransferase